MFYKKIFTWYGLPLAICTLLLFWLMYYYMFLAGVKTASTAYLDKATYSEEDKYFIEINSYDNVFEIKLNYYTDTSLPEKDEDGKYGTKVMYSTGAQFLNGVQYKQVEVSNPWSSFFKGKRFDSVELKNGYYYDTEMGGQNYSSLKHQAITSQDKWIWDIKGELCWLQTKKGQGNVKVDQRLWVSVYRYFDTSFFIKEISDTVNSLEAGEHIFYLHLSQYFFVTKGTDIKAEPTDDVNYLYVPIKVSKNSGRMTTVRQSMFGRVEDDPNWSLNKTPAEKYWKNAYEYDLSNNDFTVVFEQGGYYLKLKNDCEEYLKNFEDLLLNIKIDLDKVMVGSVNVDATGFTDNLYQFEIGKITLKSNKERTFALKDKSIKTEIVGSVTVTYAEVNDV